MRFCSEKALSTPVSKIILTLVFNDYFCIMARGKSKTAIPKQCPVCSKTFIAKSSKGKYCGELCRQKSFHNAKRLEALQPLQNKIVDLSAQAFLQEKIINENVSPSTTPTENVSTPTENVSTPEKIVPEINNVSKERTCDNSFTVYLLTHCDELCERLVKENVNEVPELRKEVDKKYHLWRSITQCLDETH